MQTMNSLPEFIAFFEAIPDENWLTKNFATADKTCRCALGHLFIETEGGFVPSENAFRLLELVQHMKKTLVEVNDKPQVGYPYGRPKARVLAFLKNAIKG